MSSNEVGMMRALFFVLVLLISVSSYAQIIPKFNGSYVSAPLESIILDLEEQFQIKFFYDHDWIDTVQISGDFINARLDTVLNKVFTNQKLSYFLSGNQVYISYQKPIINQFGIGKFFNRESNYEPIKKGLIFAKEYQKDQEGINELEKVYEVGDRYQFVMGETASIAGYVSQSGNELPVEGAFIYVEEPFVGTSTDASGFYTLSIPTGKHILLLQSIEMKNTYRNIVVFSDGTINIEMEVDVIALNEVVVNSQIVIIIFEQAQMGVTKIGIEETKSMPVLLGERDIVKAATTTSGVQAVGEGAAGVNIRGGKADQNLFTIDGATVYNTSHFFGFFSIFNSESLEGMELFKGGIPAKYGGRLSSVFDITTKEPDKEKDIQSKAV